MVDLMLCEQRGRFLFEVRPDLFPEGYLTDGERWIQVRFTEYLNNIRKA